jgi:hypothetical protein
MKDCTPFPAAAAVAAGTTRLAVLVDAEKVSPSAFMLAEQHIAAVGAPVLLRYFSVDASREWAAMEQTKKFEHFRVDSFIPVNMQLAADAAHIIDHHKANHADAVAFVVCKAEAAAYEVLLDNFKDSGVALFVFDEEKLRARS